VLDAQNSPDQGGNRVSESHTREAAAAHEQAVLRYAREHLAVEPRDVERIYCATTPNLGDGFTVRRNAAALAVYEENLFKFAPVLGRLLATACLNGSTSSSPECDHN
jgi:sarcosine oxidase